MYANRRNLRVLKEIGVEEHDGDVRFWTGSGNIALSFMRHASGHNYTNSSFIVDVTMEQIPRSTERISSLSINRAQQPGRGLPSNVFRRYGCRQSFNNLYKDVAHPSPNFHRESKSAQIWRRLKHHSNLSRQRLNMQQDIRILKQKCNAAMIALCPGQIWWSWVHAKTC